MLSDQGLEPEHIGKGIVFPFWFEDSLDPLEHKARGGFTIIENGVEALDEMSISTDDGI